MQKVLGLVFLWGRREVFSCILYVCVCQRSVFLEITERAKSSDSVVLKILEKLLFFPSDTFICTI